jgi:predicted Zn-dependent protease
MYALHAPDYEKALTNAQEAIRIDPDEIRGYLMAAAAYLGMNRVDEAKAVSNAGLQRNPNFATLHFVLAGIAYDQGDMATMEKEETFLNDPPDLAMRANTFRGDVAASHGQIPQARDFYQKTGQIANRLQLKDAEAHSLTAQAWMLALFGYSKQSIEAATAGLAISQGYSVKLIAADSMAFAGDNKKALQLASEIAKDRPDDTLVHEVYVPTVQAAVALNGGNAKNAIELLQPALTYDKGYPSSMYVRGLAYLKSGQGTEATEEFQKILARHNMTPADPLMSLSHLGLARAYALSGNSAKSRAAYQDFFALWKDANPDIPLLKQAQAEYAKL